MQEDSERLKIALRVLAAVAEYCEPEEADLELIRSYAPLSTRRHPDELACEVIQQVLKARGQFTDGMAEKVRRSMAGPVIRSRQTQGP